MLRLVAALARTASACSSQHAIGETCARAVSVGLATPGRRYASMPDPDPEANPEPSQNVLSIVDSILDLSVKELVWLNKLMKDRLGIDDRDMMPMGMPMQMGAAAAVAEPAAPAEPEKSEFKVLVEAYEASSKIKIIKEVRAILPELGLKDAKDLVRRAGAT